MITYDRSTPVQVINAAYDMSGNGGRKILRLGNGWFVSAENNAGTIQFQVSKDNYAITPTALCSISGYVAGGFALACYGNIVKVLWTDGTHAYFNSFDATTVTNIDLNSSKVTLDTLTTIGTGASITVDSSGNLYAVWLGMIFATYPYSVNVRFAKSTDGGTTWTKADGNAGIDQVTINNTSSMNWSGPCIVVSSISVPYITAIRNYNPLYIAVLSTANVGSDFTVGSGWHSKIIYTGTYTQYFPCAVITSDGVIHITWHGVDVDNASYPNIFYSKSTDGGVTWAAITEMLPHDNVYRTTPSLGYNDSNQPYIVYNDNGTIKFMYYTTSWQTPETIGTGTNPSVCLFSRFSKPVTLFMGGSDVKLYGIWTGLEYIKNFTATSIATVSAARYKGFVKVLTAYASVRTSAVKNINKVLSAISKVLASFTRSSNYRPVYPRLTVIEYPVSMLVTEYPIIMEVKGMPKSGSTVTLQGTFPNSAGNLALLTNVTLKVYGPGKVLLQTIAAAEVSLGVYSAEYTIPADTFGTFDFEFSGTLGSKTIIGRSSFDSNWR